MSTTQELLAAKERYDAFRLRIAALGVRIAENTCEWGCHEWADDILSVLEESE
jgi:hypothetical protein